MKYLLKFNVIHGWEYFISTNFELYTQENYIQMALGYSDSNNSILSYLFLKYNTLLAQNNFEEINSNVRDKIKKLKYLIE
jgi:hypothetical protein